MSLNDGLGNRQSKTTALGFNRAGLSDTKKSLKDAGKVLFGDADSLIVKLDPNVRAGGEGDPQSSAGRRVFNRIVNEDQEELPQESGIAAEKDVVLQFALNADLLVVGQRGRQTARLF